MTKHSSSIRWLQAPLYLQFHVLTNLSFAYHWMSGCMLSCWRAKQDGGRQGKETFERPSVTCWFVCLTPFLKAYEFFNHEYASTNLRIRTPETIRDVSKVNLVALDALFY